MSRHHIKRIPAAVNAPGQAEQQSHRAGTGYPPGGDYSEGF